MGGNLGCIAVAFKVADVAKSAEFYRHLGFVPIDEEDWTDGYASFKYGDFVLQLMDFISEDVLINLAVKDADELSDTWSQVAERGIPIRAEAHGAQWEDPDNHSFYLFVKEPGRHNEALGE